MSCVNPECFGEFQIVFIGRLGPANVLPDVWKKGITPRGINCQ